MKNLEESIYNKLIEKEKETKSQGSYNPVS